MNDPSKNGNANYQHERDISIDMNPMVDLAFLLLSFFMLTTTFNQPQAMEIIMPVKPTKDALEKEQPIKESRAFSIILGPDDKIYWYRGITDAQLQETSFSSEGIRKVIEENHALVDKMVVLIKPHPGSVFRNLVDILDELNYTDTKRYAIDKFTDFDEELLNEFESADEAI